MQTYHMQQVFYAILLPGAFSAHRQNTPECQWAVTCMHRSDAIFGGMFIANQGLSDDVTKLQWYKYLLIQLPPVNRSTLKRIITHLARWVHLSFLYSGCCKHNFAFSALTLLVGRQEEHLACKWGAGVLSGVRCRLAYGPADAVAAHCILLH